MNITCPQCNKIYKIDKNKIDMTNRSVQCYNCKHIWSPTPEAPAIYDNEKPNENLKHPKKDHPKNPQKQHDSSKLPQRPERKEPHQKKPHQNEVPYELNIEEQVQKAVAQALKDFQPETTKTNLPAVIQPDLAEVMKEMMAENQKVTRKLSFMIRFNSLLIMAVVLFLLFLIWPKP